MKTFNLIRTVLFICISFLPVTMIAQVKIGGKPKEIPDPSAILDLQGTDRGFLLPRLTQEQMLAVKEPANALIIFNTDSKALYIFSAEQKQWLPLLQQTAKPEGESCEWEFDTTTLRVFLVRGYPLGDSIYYNTARKKFVFSDKPTWGETNIPVDVQFPGKFIVKGTASGIYNDSASLNFPSLTLSNFLFEADNDSFALANPGQAFYNGMRISSQLLPSAMQKVNTLRSLLLQVNHTGSDSVSAVTSLASNGFIDGRGYTAAFNGFQNNMSVTGNSRSNIGSMTGYRNNITMAPEAGGHVTGNVTGYFGSMTGFADSAGNKLVNGNAYGIFLGNVSIAAPKKNFAFYSNKGHNRFADSTLITDGFFTSPRAVLDVNSTSAMITPAGTTAERPGSPVTAMLRYNTSNAGMEYYNGSAWKSFNGDSSEWRYDGSANRVDLVRGLGQNDSIYYNITKRKFVFSDKRTFGNTDIALDDQFPGKYFFKGTASRMFNDSVSVNFPSLTMSNFLYEVDNDPFAIANPNQAFYNGIRVSTQLLPTATQKASTIRALNLQANHTGSDSLGSITSVISNAFVDGKGFTGNFTGIQNNMSVTETARNNIGTIFGYRNSINMDQNAGGRINGNVFGYFGSMTGFADSSGNRYVNGNAYGIFLNNVAIAGPKKNYAFYSNKGHNRFADSTLITDGFFTSPRAVLDINSTSAMITPSGTSAQRPAAPVTAMLRHNTSNANMEYFNGTTWKALSADSAEWTYDNTTGHVNLSRGMLKQDTIFYDAQSRQFVFADRNINTNSLGNDFPVQDFGAKYTFKTTASKRDSSQVNGANTNIIYEVDNTTSGTQYNALSTSTVMNPKAFQHADLLSGITNTVIHAGNDSVQQLIGISNTARNSGNGKSGSITGIQNLVRISNGTGDNTGEMVGFRNIMSRGGINAGKITGNIYGWLGSFSGFANNVEGSMYGIYMNSVTGAGDGKNYAFYSNKGLNRLGDSLLITDGSAISPRAVLDVNATSAMIIPAGNSSQRPSAAITGMVRYNTENGGHFESYNGTAWSGILRGTVVIDPPSISVNSGVTMSIAFAGATLGSVVAVSPVSPLPGGLMIAWARVSAANSIDIRFEVNSNPPVNPPALTYDLRVIQ